MTRWDGFVTEYLQDPIVGRELFDFFLGTYIGSGSYRDVFNHNENSKLVVKIENREAHGDNWAELRLWRAVENTEYAKWFAPCKYISTNGIILYQRKTAPIETKEKKIPKEIPAFFTDVKRSNFGWIGNQLVCHDYSHCLEKFTSQSLSKRMQSTRNKLYWE